MVIKDAIYGEINIDTQIIVDIINSKTFQRLKKVRQAGPSGMIQSVRTTTRFAHSIGVWYLSHKFNRPIEEQIACLIHDISHTAFSHVADLVFPNENHEFADKKLNEFIYNSEIPEILARNKIDIKKVLEKTDYNLLDNNLPDISFDRVDYFLRDANTFGILDNNTIEIFLKNLSEENQILYFSDARTAGHFAIMFMNASRLIWLDPISVAAHQIMAKIIKTTLEDGDIDEKDFFEDEDTLLLKLKSSKNITVENQLKRLNPDTNFEYCKKEEAEFWGNHKPRFVNPLVKVNNQLVRVDTLIPNLTYFFQEFMERYKEVGVREVFDL